MALLAASPLTLFTADATPRPNLEQVRKQVDDLHDQAEVATERYNAVRERIAALNVQLTGAQTRLADQRKAVELARAALGQVAVDLYKAGDLATLSLFFSDRPDRFLAANDLMVSIGQRKSEAVDDLLHQQKQLLSSMTDVQEQQQNLEQARTELAGARSEVLRKLSAATQLLAKLTSDERARLGQLRSGRDRLTFTDLGIKVPPSGQVTCPDVPVTAPNARIAKVLDYACAQLGDDYQWGGSGPRTFDCSGLTMMAWRQAGISLPHNAAEQSTYGTSVSANDLQPGDLVFFHKPISHVAIYLGNGVMLHAPRTGDVVKIAPMRYGDMISATRL